jgi:hypothetical protein
MDDSAKFGDGRKKFWTSFDVNTPSWALYLVGEKQPVFPSNVYSATKNPRSFDGRNDFLDDPDSSPPIPIKELLEIIPEYISTLSFE